MFFWMTASAVAVREYIRPMTASAFAVAVVSTFLTIASEEAVTLIVFLTIASELNEGSYVRWITASAVVVATLYVR